MGCGQAGFVSTVLQQCDFEGSPLPDCVKPQEQFSDSVALVVAGVSALWRPVLCAVLRVIS